MKLTVRKSFIVGVAAVFGLFAVIFAWLNFQMMGGTHADSPDGQYMVLLSGPLSPRRSGTYTLTLFDKKTSAEIRELTLTVPATESTVSVREGGGSILWNDESTYADIKIDGADVLRIWVP